MADSSDVVAGTNATASQYNNLRKDLVLAKSIRNAETYGVTITIDWSAVSKGKVRDITLTASTATIAFSGDVDDQWLIVNIIQDGTGSRTLVAWPAGIKWPGNTAPTLSTAANAIDTFIFHRVSAGVYRAYFAGFDVR